MAQNPYGDFALFAFGVMMEKDESTTSTLDIVDPLNAVKIIAQDDSAATIGGYGVVFGARDIQGETFDADTDYMLDLVPEKLLLYDHGLMQIKNAFGFVANDDILIDDAGMWIQGQIDKSAKYSDLVLQLIDKGVLGWSSGSVEHLSRRKGGVIKTWPIVEFSLTPTPAEPRTLGVDRIKAMAESNPSLKALLPEADQETRSEDATATDVEADVIELEDEVKIMSDKQEKGAEKEPLTLEQIGEAMKSALEPFSDRLAKLEEKPDNELEVAKKNVNVVADTEHWKYDNVDSRDLAIMVGVLDTAKQYGQSKGGASTAAFKALGMRLESEESRKSEPLTVARNAMKMAGIKANEINQSTLASYGDEWVGVAYSGELWRSIRHATFVLQNLPNQMEVPQGAESVVIPLESTDPVWYKVAQSASLSANPGGIPTNTVTASNLGTANNTLTLAKMGARVLWTGELEEDAVLPYVAQLRSQLTTSGAEYLEHVLIDGDTATGATTNINDIGGTPGGDEAFLLLNGFRKSPLVTTTANSRDGGALAVEDYLETVKLMGLAGKNAIDKSSVSFIIDPWTHWKSLELTEVKTQDVFSAPTIENGTLMNIWGYDVNTSIHMHKANQDATYGLKANSAGKLDLDTASNNTTGVILAVRWDQWQFGWRRRMTLETTRIPAADATEIVSLMRFGMVQRDTEASTISYNLTL
jgi:phage head maturation protease